MSKKTRKYYELNTEKNELTIYLYDDIMASDLFWGIDGSSKEIRDMGFRFVIAMIMIVLLPTFFDFLIDFQKFDIFYVFL